jgi:hypothetical protein
MEFPNFEKRLAIITATFTGSMVTIVLIHTIEAGFTQN